MKSLEKLIDAAKDVLDKNWLGNSTQPAPELYPHQWNWDSAFIAIGYANYDQERAQQELSTLFKAQWSNGMLPQIVFDPRNLGNYFPEPDFWQAERSPHHPEDMLTSGITMPPVHAIAARRIYELADDKDLCTDWFEDMYPRLYAMHEYFHRDRDPENTGLVYIRHPWESGLDNTPVWDTALKRMEIDKSRLPDYQRKDLDKGIPPEQRPSDDEYDRYVYLIDLFRRENYDEKAIWEKSPFKTAAILLCAILSRADEDLAWIGNKLGKNTEQLQQWHEQANNAMRERCWHAEHGGFDVWDFVADERIGTLTASSFSPLLCGAPTEKEADIMQDTMDSTCFCRIDDDDCYAVPNYSTEGEFFDADNYWRGPVWININWLLMHGLRRYGFADKADAIRKDTIRLIDRHGFHEYFDPFSGEGYGTKDFSWTAALFIDIAMEEMRQDS